jgi:hypothetical protein
MPFIPFLVCFTPKKMGHSNCLEWIHMAFLSTLATLATLVTLDPRKGLSHIFEIAHGKMDMIHSHMVRS